ncbi:MAG TPA: decarboxylating 6-phosphogluconate dehydrogenase [Burkholderiales bacterium]|nr:decarboxylating 6-phosphogluconate dehydrogenase [Burkholderiales bacterium]
MGAKMAERLTRGGHRVAGFDPNPEARARAAAAAASLPQLVEKLAAPRVLWLMVPAGPPVDEAIAALVPHLAAGDTLIDGGNSFYRDTQRRARQLAESRIAYVDVGTSGGIWGREKGYCMMVGGEQAAVERLRPIFQALAPTPEKGWAHVGPSGAGHFVKMVHNGIEYGLMQAYAEGFALMQHKREFSLDLHAIAEVWREGSVIRSWLLDLTASALRENPGLDGIAPHVADSGEGRWTVAEAIALDVPAPVITLSLLERLRSRDRNSYADRLLAALRREFGGHDVKTSS